MDFKKLALARMMMNQGAPQQRQTIGPSGTPTGGGGLNTPNSYDSFTAPEISGNIAIGKQGQGSNPLDPRSLSGMFSRGQNVYNGGSMAAHSGPNRNMGRPVERDKAQALRRVRAS